MIVQPFSIAWVNPEEPKPSDGRDLVTCEICGKKGLPFPPWLCYEFGISTMLYEYTYWLCSEKCDKKATPEVKAKRIKELSKR